MKKLIALTITISLCNIANAEHAIDVERLSSAGDHFKALVAFQKLPVRTLSAEVKIAAANSAWALGLHGKAAYEFDSVLRGETQISPERRAKLLISRSAIEYQEGRYQEAILFGEKAVSILTNPSPLRARGLMLIGEALLRMRSYGHAEERFSQALTEAQSDDSAEITFHRGKVRMRLGRYEQAEEDLKRIPLNHERAPEALKILAQIAFDAGRYEEAETWLTKGRDQFPESFLDSWVDYALIKSSAERGKKEHSETLLQQAQTRFPPSDPWLSAAESVVEVRKWEDPKLVTLGGDDGGA